MDDRIDCGVCYCVAYCGSGKSDCAFCLRKRAEEEFKFVELKDKDSDLENKAIFLLMRRMKWILWMSLTSSERDELKREAAKFEGKKPVTVHEERFAAIHDIEKEWADLLCEKINYMQAADDCLYDCYVIKDGKRRIMIEKTEEND